MAVKDSYSDKVLKDGLRYSNLFDFLAQKARED